MSIGMSWKTEDGRVIPIRLMDSAHLVNTFNMLAHRRLGLMPEEIDRLIATTHSDAPLLQRQLRAMSIELKARRLFEWAPSDPHRIRKYGQLVKTKRRETLTQLCMWAAMIDCNAIYPVGDPTLFSRNPQAVVDEVIRLSETHSDFRRVNAVFVQYRMEFA